MKKSKSKFKITIETIIILIISGLMLFLIDFTNNKFNEITINDREALLIHHDPNNPVHEDLAKEIIEFRPDACKMIEVFTEDFKPIFQVQFTADTNPSPDTILDHPDLLDLFKNNTEGHTEITLNEKDEDIYFQWSTTDEGSKCLIIIYMSRPVVKNLWVFSFVCYIILILIFILLIRLHIIQYNARIQHYRSTTLGVQDKLINR